MRYLLDLRAGTAIKCGLSALAITTVTLSAGLAKPPPNFERLEADRLSADDFPVSAMAQDNMINIPAGVYTIGRDGGPRDQAPAHSVRLAAFRMDRTEVTNAGFAEYLNALRLQLGLRRGAPASVSVIADTRTVALLNEGNEGSGRYPIIALDDEQVRIEVRDGAFAPTRGYEQHPVAETTWAGARAYCAWRGGRLPTEAEWEAAARGDDNRLYPWGNQPPSSERVFASGRSGVTGPVGDRPAGASPFGVLDMSASLAEWTSSLKRPYPYNARDGREDPSVAGERVTRGGDYRYDRRPETLTVSHRSGFSNAPERGHRHIGFRCAA